MTYDNLINKKCAPSKKFIDGSCLSYKSLKRIVNNYNKKNKDEIDVNLPKKMLVKKLESKLEDKCSNHICWLRLDIVKELNDNDINNYTFRPTGPKNKYDWLSTYDINNVIEQYHSIHKDFIFLGAVPYDFENLPILNLTNINFTELKNKGKVKIGLVINLDKHNQGGSHWVSLYFDLKKYQIYFFDSVGKPPRKRIKKFINKIIKYFYYDLFKTKISLNKLYKSLNKIEKTTKEINYINNIMYYMDIRYNNIQHQFKNSECGVYCINFITRLVSGETFDNIINNVIRDEDMNYHRKIYFNNYI